VGGPEATTPAWGRTGSGGDLAVEAWLGDLAVRLCSVDGVVGVMLGGSRARGEHAPTSDHDLGLYYQPPLDTGALRALARAVSGPDAEVTEPGEWGPWVDGGAWLRISGAAVDWIYRDLDRVHGAWDDAQRGQFRFNAQIGHPLGVPDFAYAGEVALGIVLHDPSGRLTHLQEVTRTYPPELAGALVERLWEADFLLAGVRKSFHREDFAWAAGCLFRVVLLCAHALHGRAGRWLINEKGAVTSAGRLPISPPGFSHRAHHLLGHLGTTTAELANSLDQADELVSDTREACRVAP
jgi:predicted nucleotidyltransferase